MRNKEDVCVAHVQGRTLNLLTYAGGVVRLYAPDKIDPRILIAGSPPTVETDEELVNLVRTHGPGVYLVPASIARRAFPHYTFHAPE